MLRLLRKAIRYLVLLFGSKPDVPQEKLRHRPLGFDSGSVIDVGATREIIVRPQCLFRPDSFTVPHGIAECFSVDAIMIGGRNQLVSNDPVPAVAFSHAYNGPKLKFDSVCVGMDVKLIVTNTSLDGARFRAVMIGPTVE